MRRNYEKNYSENTKTVIWVHIINVFYGKYCVCIRRHAGYGASDAQKKTNATQSIILFKSHNAKRKLFLSLVNLNKYGFLFELAPSNISS